MRNARDVLFAHGVCLLPTDARPFLFVWLVSCDVHGFSLAFCRSFRRSCDGLRNLLKNVLPYIAPQRAKVARRRATMNENLHKNRKRFRIRLGFLWLRSRFVGVSPVFRTAAKQWQTVAFLSVRSLFVGFCFPFLESVFLCLLCF